MADIELVIKIPEEIYEASQILDVKYKDTVQIPLEVIANSTPLPNGHGDLKDADAMINKLCTHEASEFFGNVTCAEILDFINDADTIIEADKDSESKELYTKVKDISENHYYKENNDNSYPGYLCNEDGSVCR